MNAFIIDSSLDARTALRDLLRQVDSIRNIWEGTTGRSTSSAFRSTRIDMIFTNIDTPESGLEFIKELKAKQRWKNIPIVAICPKGTMEEGQQAIESGVTMAIYPPLTLEQIQTAMALRTR